MLDGGDFTLAIKERGSTCCTPGFWHPQGGNHKRGGRAPKGHRRTNGNILSISH